MFSAGFGAFRYAQLGSVNLSLVVPLLAGTDDREQALELQKEDRSVVHGELSDVETIEAANVREARAVVVDTSDEHTASVVLSVREVNPNVPMVALATQPARRTHLRYAGADEVVTPRDILGRRLAERVANELQPQSSDVAAIGDGLHLLELTVPEDSSLAGSTVGGIEGEARDSLSVVGIRGEGGFLSAPGPDTRVEPDAELVLVGDRSSLEALEIRAHRDREAGGRVVVAGHGLVGSTVVQRLEEAGFACTVVDVEDGEGVDVVGDATDEDVLAAAGLSEARAFVISIADDDEAILAALVASRRAEATIVARLNDPGNEAKIRRAGADYVLSLPTISGRVLAREILHERILSLDRQLKVVRIPASELAELLLPAEGLQAPGCALVAIERGGELLTDLTGPLELQPDDQLIVVGGDERIDAIQRDGS